MQALGSQGTDWAIGLTGVRLWGLLVGFSIGAIAIGLWWGGKRWLKLAGIFAAITAVLYTTFFSNLAGLGTGLIGSLGYWLSQQGVARGGQPELFLLDRLPALRVSAAASAGYAQRSIIYSVANHSRPSRAPLCHSRCGGPC